MVSVAVWANSLDVPTEVCADARLRDREAAVWPWQDRPVQATDRTYGQAGWDIGMRFSDIHDLASKLHRITVPAYVRGAPSGGRPIRRGEVNKLAINAHGTMGQVFINGKGKTPLDKANLHQNHGDLHRIGLITPDDAASPAVILFVGCLAATGASGTELLIGLSRIWPNRNVVGFATIGYQQGGLMLRPGEACTAPGMRDTDAIFSGGADATAGTNWPSLTRWPWASIESPHAKVAFNGRIIRGEEF